MGLGMVSHGHFLHSNLSTTAQGVLRQSHDGLMHCDDNSEAAVSNSLTATESSSLDDPSNRNFEVNTSGSADDPTENSGLPPLNPADEEFIRVLKDKINNMPRMLIKIIYLYSGPAGEAQGFDHFATRFNAVAEMIDNLVDDVKYDMLETCNQQRVEREVDNGEYDGGLIASPCSSFSAARDNVDGDDTIGPRYLRGPEPPEIYGIADLDEEEREFVKAGTTLAVFGSKIAGKLTDQRKPWISETPQRRDGKASVHTLPEWRVIQSREGVSLTDFPQCELGARSMKPTELMHFEVNLDDFPKACSHPRQQWTVPWSGHTYWSSHPHLRGKQWAITTAEWRPWKRRRWPPTGPYITKGAAVYTPRLNLKLAYKLIFNIKKGSALLTHEVILWQ